LPPLITIVGHSNSGKTTLLEKLVRELTARGYKIATIKDSHRQPSFDCKDKDSWRHIQSGSCMTALRTHDRIIIISKASPDTNINEIANLMGEEFDLILAEGFKESDAPKIEVHRSGMDLLQNKTNLIAIATDEQLSAGECQFNINDTTGIADFIEREYLNGRNK